MTRICLGGSCRGSSGLKAHSGIARKLNPFSKYAALRKDRYNKKINKYYVEIAEEDSDADGQEDREKHVEEEKAFRSTSTCIL